MKSLLANASCPRHENQGEPKISVERVAWAVSAASRYIPKGRNCLLRAITTHYLLKKLGYPSMIHIGVDRSAENTLAAHAWVENEGKVVIGGLGDLTRFNSLMPGRREQL